jgi:hypothetical protein
LADHAGAGATPAAGADEEGMERDRCCGRDFRCGLSSDLHRCGASEIGDGMKQLGLFGPEFRPNPDWPGTFICSCVYTHPGRPFIGDGPEPDDIAWHGDVSCQNSPPMKRKGVEKT